MKKYFVIAAAIVMALVSCTKESNPVSEKQLVKMSFTTSSDAYKTVLGDDMSVTFAAGEEIAVFADGTCYKFTTEAGGKNAVFTGEAPVTDTYYAVAPYSVASSATISEGKIVGISLTKGSSWCSKGTYASTKGIAVAVSTDKNFTFKNICALLKITVPAEVTGLQEMVFFARNSESFSGILTVDPSDASFTATTSYTQTGAAAVDITSGGTFEAGTYYIPILPCTCTKGFDVKLTYSDSHVTRGFNGNSITIARNAVINLGTIKDTKEFVYENFESGSVPSDLVGNTNALKVVENPFKTSTNSSDYVLANDMHTSTSSTSGYIQTSGTLSTTVFPTSIRGQYKRVILKVYLGTNKYYPRLVWNKNSSSVFRLRPARINGVTATDQATWDANVKTDDWNVLEWDASQFPKDASASSYYSSLTEFSSFQFRFFVDWDNNNTTYDADIYKRLVYIDDLSFGL